MIYQWRWYSHDVECMSRIGPMSPRRAAAGHDCRAEQAVMIAGTAEAGHRPCITAAATVERAEQIAISSSRRTDSGRHVQDR